MYPSGNNDSEPFSEGNRIELDRPADIFIPPKTFLVTEAVLGVLELIV